MKEIPIKIKLKSTVYLQDRKNMEKHTNKSYSMTRDKDVTYDYILKF